MVFSYYWQPWKAVYISFGAILLLIRIPYWVLRNLLPAFRPRRSWSLARSVILEILNATTAILLEIGLPEEEHLKSIALASDRNGFVWVEPRSDLVMGEIQQFAEANGVHSERIGGFWYGSKDSGGRVGHKARPGDKVVLFLHGGGFVAGSGAPSSALTATICNGLLEHVPMISRLFALEYRLAAGPPFKIQNPFPAALIDAIAGYRYLLDLEFDPRNIIIAGDSAGAILAYQLVRYTTTHEHSLLQCPGAALMLSPCGDTSFRKDPETSMTTNRRSDYLRSWIDAGYPAIALAGRLSASEVGNSWLSPGILENGNDMEGVFAGFPPSFILVGEAEMCRDSMRVFRDRMLLDIGKDQVTYVEVKDAPHDFLGFNFLEPERSIALRKIATWVDTL
ncbi:alpha/beta-hydrolase [Lentinula raphanica]|uniref:Alpha/beta-hydrolase n=1 Tax=Lentinula raphanica TaxID=153919 RepID=A0AA38PG23_9AGAR|nr:alpha/beta-hydrolase [Lentinula raphanica]KAJ3970935.1 alpha/beta-hydrolase [Lentinula raphanica]